MMRAVRLTIVERRAPAPEHVELMVDAKDLAGRLVPGQFLHVAAGGTLRRPLSVSRVEGARLGMLFRVVGAGTAWLAERDVGETVDVMGPLGQGYPPPPPGPLALVGGGVGIPPLFFYAQRWPDAALSVLLGARDHDSLIMVDDFRGLGLRPGLCTDDGSRGKRGRVTGLLRDWFLEHPDGSVMACGPAPMLHEVARLTAAAGRPAWLGFEQRMGCGVGACLACVVPGAPGGDRVWYRVCTDGPVFARETLYGEGRP